MQTKHVSLEDYRANIFKLFQILNASSRHVLFATTTPFPGCMPGCLEKGKRNLFPSDVLLYNAAARAALPPGSRINDLYSRVIEFCGEGYEQCSLQLEENVHFNDAGNTFLSGHVATAITEGLGEVT